MIPHAYVYVLRGYTTEIAISAKYYFVWSGTAKYFVNVFISPFLILTIQMKEIYFSLESHGQKHRKNVAREQRETDELLYIRQHNLKDIKNKMEK